MARDKRETKIDMACCGVRCSSRSGVGASSSASASAADNRGSARRGKLLYYDDFVTLDSTVMIKVKTRRVDDNGDGDVKLPGTRVG